MRLNLRKMLRKKTRRFCVELSLDEEDKEDLAESVLLSTKSFGRDMKKLNRQLKGGLV